MLTINDRKNSWTISKRQKDTEWKTIKKNLSSLIEEKCGTKSS